MSNDDYDYVLVKNLDDIADFYDFVTSPITKVSNLLICQSHDHRKLMPFVDIRQMVWNWRTQSDVGNRRCDRSDGEPKSTWKQVWLRCSFWYPCFAIVLTISLSFIHSYVLLHHMLGEVNGAKGSWGFVEGGMGTVSLAIAKSAIEHGAEIFVNQVMFLSRHIGLV